MKRFYTGIIAILTFVCMLGGIIYTQRPQEALSTAASSVFLDKDPKRSYYEEKERALLGFIKKRLTDSQGGIITNTHPQSGDLNTLSESIGILLDYAVINSNKRMFDRKYNYFVKELLTKDYYIKWRSGTDVTCNASIDDLRITEAILRAFEKWRGKEYLDTAQSIQQKIFETQVVEDNLYEIFDWKYNTRKATAPLCYLDLRAMRSLKFFNKDWNKVSDRAISVLRKGRIEDSPFFYKYFDYNKGKYLFDEEYEKNKSICLIYTLYTALHMAEAGVPTDDLKNWLSSELEKGKIYAWYNPHSKKPVSEMESTAVYALGSIYARLSGDKELSRKLLDRMLEFMVTDEKSSYYGGFGNKETGEFYSFDNLTALWALTVSRN